MKEKTELLMKQENNCIHLAGWTASPITYSHTAGSSSYYSFYLNTPRGSGTMDRLNIVISEDTLKTLPSDAYYPGYQMEFDGYVRSHNKAWGGKRHLILYVYALHIIAWQDPAVLPCTRDCNWAELEGYIVQAPKFRETPSGKQITDLILAVNRPNKESDYIPCIAWGGAARTASYLTIGEKIRVSGRFQSRQYKKTYEDSIQEIRTAYELSICRWNRADREAPAVPKK